MFVEFPRSSYGSCLVYSSSFRTLGLADVAAFPALESVRPGSTCGDVLFTASSPFTAMEGPDRYGSADTAASGLARAPNRDALACTILAGECAPDPTSTEDFDNRHETTTAFENVGFSPVRCYNSRLPL